MSSIRRMINSTVSPSHRGRRSVLTTCLSCFSIFMADLLIESCLSVAPEVAGTLGHPQIFDEFSVSLRMSHPITTPTSNQLNTYSSNIERLKANHERSVRQLSAKKSLPQGKVHVPPQLLATIWSKNLGTYKHPSPTIHLLTPSLLFSGDDE